nr:putative ribonuclease H-like domain-containing protein [Tanacetum cinerariifolium]
FKLTNESNILLKVPRKDNMYNIDLKNDIPQGGIENLIDLRVRVIRCDNGTEFKNRVMNQFCEMKGIKREFSVARTPQQNGVAEKKNRTLIEDAKTMLADSKLPITFGLKQLIMLVMSKIGCKTRVETVPNKDYILLPLWTQEPLFSYSSKDFPGASHKPSGEEEKKNIEDPGNEDSEATIIEKPRFNQENESVNSTNRVNAVISIVNAASNEVNVVGRKLSIELPYDPNMPELEDISIFEDSNKDVFGV